MKARAIHRKIVELKKKLKQKILQYKREAVEYLHSPSFKRKAVFLVKLIGSLGAIIAILKLLARLSREESSVIMSEIARAPSAAMPPSGRTAPSLRISKGKGLPASSFFRPSPLARPQTNNQQKTTALAINPPYPMSAIASGKKPVQNSDLMQRRYVINCKANAMMFEMAAEELDEQKAFLRRLAQIKKEEAAEKAARFRVENEFKRKNPQAYNNLMKAELLKSEFAKKAQTPAQSAHIRQRTLPF